MEQYNIHKHLKALEEYLKVKLQQRDWHGVRDVCVDIEVLEAVIRERTNENMHSK